MSAQTQPAFSLQSNRRNIVLISVVTWIYLVLLLILALWMMRPPRPLAVAAPAQDFSAERAAGHVRVVARVAHPIGSVANMEVERYLVAQLLSLGLEAKTFVAIGATTDNGHVFAGETHDIVGRLRGIAPSRALMLVAHYDSGYHAPGAADDGAGLAVILETLRALHAGPALKNDLIVLLTDGEEAGLLGAEAFFSSHPWMKDVGLILNFEARGNQGISLLFETSSGNRALINEMTRVTPHPNASSLFYALYKMLPNDTDFTVFRPLRVPGLNFAFGAGFDAYHTPLDTPQNLSLASLQQQGSNALSLTRHFAQQDLNRIRQSETDSVFFNPFGTILITYSESWALGGQLVATVLLLFLTVRLVRELGTKALLVVLFVESALLVIIPVAAALVWWLLASILEKRLIVADSPSNALLLIGIICFSTALSCLLFMFCSKRFSGRQLTAGALILLGCLTWALTLLLPAGSYILFWPFLLMSLGAFAIEVLQKKSHLYAEFIAGIASISAAMLLFTPLIYLIYVFLTLQTVVVVAAGMFTTILFLSAAPAMSVLIPRPGRWPLVLVALLFACFAACILAGVHLSYFSAEHPRRDSVFYGLNADDHTAVWISRDHSVDSWTSQFFPVRARSQKSVPACFAGDSASVITAPAPTIDLIPPVAEVKSDVREQNGRELRLIVRSMRQAYAIHLRLADGIKGSSLTINGRNITLAPSSSLFKISLYGMADKEVELRLQLSTSSNISFTLADESIGLPNIAPARSQEFVPDFESDTTFVSRTYLLHR